MLNNFFITRLMSANKTAAPKMLNKHDGLGIILTDRDVCWNINVPDILNNSNSFSFRITKPNAC